MSQKVKRRNTCDPKQIKKENKTGNDFWAAKN
jgi:hypothetical protein